MCGKNLKLAGSTLLLSLVLLLLSWLAWPLPLQSAEVNPILEPPMTYEEQTNYINKLETQLIKWMDWYKLLTKPYQDLVTQWQADKDSWAKLKLSYEAESEAKNQVIRDKDYEISQLKTEISNTKTNTIWWTIGGIFAGGVLGLVGGHYLK
jgi:hypothetical protein